MIEERTRKWARLLALCRKGDETAWATLYNSFRPLVAAEIRRWQVGGAVAEDLIQDVFLRLVTGIDRIREPLALVAYLRAAARHAVIDHFRRIHATKRGENTTLSIDCLAEELGADRISGVSVTAGNTDGEERFGADEVRILLDCIAQLSPPQRELITLHFIEELPYEEISRRTGIRPGTLAVRVHRYLNALKKLVIAKNAVMNGVAIRPLLRGETTMRSKE